MALSDAQKYILRYWKQVRKSTGGLPSRTDFTLKGLGRYAPNIAILAFQDSPVDFKYTLIGTSVERHLPQDYTGKKLSEIPSKGPESKFWLSMLDTLNSSKPILADLPCIAPATNAQPIHTLQLPLATNRKDPDRIMIVPNFETRPFKQPGIRINIG